MIETARYQKQPLHPVQEQQFGSGIGNTISATVQAIDSNKLTELMITDVGGMVLPRTGLELWKRGPDAGRETGLREIAGTFFNVYVTGLLGALLIPLFNTASLLFNPHGLHSRSWVNASNLDAFSQTFKKAVENTGSPQEARRQFIRDTLKGMVATDANQPNEALAALRKGGHDEIAKNLEAAYGKKIREGRLSTDAVNELTKLLQQSENQWRGIPVIDAQVARHRQVLLQRPEIVELADDARNAKLDKMLKQYRMALSNDALKTEKVFLQELQDVAIRGGLTNQVNVLGVQNRELGTVLKDLKHFLEQYADRVLADEATGKILATPFQDAHRTSILEKMYKNENVGGFFRGLLPKAEDGLVPYTMRAKRFMSGIPLLLGVAGGISISFLNNYITQQKHQGQVFFPGEQAFVTADKATAPLATMQAPAIEQPLDEWGHPPSRLSAGSVFERIFGFDTVRAFSLAHPRTNVIRTNLDAKTLSKQGGDPGLEPKFGAVDPFLKAFDFIEMGQSTIPQNMVVYGLTIGSRLLAASQRSWNEVREIGLRDSLGWSFWFFTTPIIQRLFVKTFAPEDAKASLLQQAAKPTEGKMLWLKQLNWNLNPLARFDLATAKQVENRLTQAKELLVKQMGGRDAAGFKEAEKVLVEHFTQVKNWRNYASAMGLAITFLLLGVGINVLNIYQTQQNVKRGRVGKNWAEGSAPQPA